MSVSQMPNDWPLVYLVGFSGSGKSTVGPLLARRLHADLYDIDQLVEKRVGMPIVGIFDQHGERYFRKCEKKTIAELISSIKSPAVVVLGGGALQHASVRKLTSATGIVVYLRCALPELFRRLKTATDRPLLSVPSRSALSNPGSRRQRMAELMRKRRSNYERADIICSTTSLTPAQAARRIETQVRNYCANNSR
ncbi:MAG: shikimate kinase [Candidatus Zixiibacteriota bacterium]